MTTVKVRRRYWIATSVLALWYASMALCVQVMLLAAIIPMIPELKPSSGVSFGHVAVVAFTALFVSWAVIMPVLHARHRAGRGVLPLR